jgi:hypothetical protein
VPQSPEVLRGAGASDPTSLEHKRREARGQGVQESVAQTAIRYCWGVPATAGVVLANEATANRKGGVVVAGRGLVVDHDGACGAAALSADHFPAVLVHPL